MDDVATRPADPEYVADLESKFAALSISYTRLMYYYRRLERRVGQYELELAVYRQGAQSDDGPDEWGDGIQSEDIVA